MREAKGLGVRALANAAGVSGGFISQVENGHVMPSVASLVKIAGALNVQVGEFFERPAAGGEVLHPGERTFYRYEEHGVLDEVLSDDPGGEIEVLLSTLQPGGGTGPGELYVHGTRVEVVYVLEGEIEIGLGDRRVKMTRGDSLTFAGDIPHGVWNTGKKPARMIWAASPARY